MKDHDPVSEIIDVLEKTCQRMCLKPDSVGVICRQSVHTLNISIVSHPEDTMKLIGKGGATVRALELVAKLMAEPLDLKVRLNVEPTERIQQTHLPFTVDPTYSPKTELALLRRMMAVIYNEDAQVKAIKGCSSTTALVAIVEGLFVQKLEDALTLIFEPIGRNHGQNLYVEIDADENKIG